MTRSPFNFRSYATARLGVLVFLAVMVGVAVGTVALLRPLVNAPSPHSAAAPVAPSLPTAKPAPKIIPVVAKPRAAISTAWVFGDSICAGQNLTPAQAWPARLAVRANVTMVNWCRPGYAFNGYLGNVSDELAAAYASGQPVPHTVIVAAGSNDLKLIHDGEPINSVKQAALAARASLLAHGAQRVLFAAVIPRGDGYETQRQDLNLWMAISFGTDYEQVDFFLNPPSEANYTKYYQSDRLHPNAVGSQLIADTFDTTRILP
jgi:lysophospholipase L1-like esterase